MTNGPQIGAWLPDEWGRHFTDTERERIIKSGIDLLLVPENHDQWANRGEWKQVADELGVALYAGFEDGDWIRGILYDPESGLNRTYTKHSTAGKIALEQDDWNPEEALRPIEFRGATVGTTICHDHYFSPFMRYEGLTGSSVLLNLSARPVQRKKWGEVLQARAIENGAYVVCTMHGTEPDGSSGGGNAHVFAFDPFGDQITLTELGTSEERQLFETRADNIYTFTADQSEATRARQTLTAQQNRPTIQRIKTNVYDKTGSGDSKIDVQVTGAELELNYSGESTQIDGRTSRAFCLGQEQFYLASLDSEQIFEPEELYTDLLSVDDIEDKTVLIHNHWSELTTQYVENVVEPILRARTVEWASPTLLTSPTESRGYQAWYTKSTHRVPTDEEDQFNFDVRWATGVGSALTPVNNRYDKMREIANLCP